MSIYSFQIPVNNSQFGVVKWDKGLTKKQCNRILREVKKLESTEGGIVRDVDQFEDNKQIRHVSTKTINVEDMPWLYDLMYAYIDEANKDFFQFDVYGLHESIQFLHYGDDIGGGHYDWHMDCGPGIANRKITVVVQLTDPTKYEGCDTEIFLNGVLDKQCGAISAFPSYLAHRVLPLVSGYRNALVMWVNGPTYK